MVKACETIENENGGGRKLKRAVESNEYLGNLAKERVLSSNICLEGRELFSKDRRPEKKLLKAKGKEN